LIYGPCRHKQELEGNTYAPIKHKYLKIVYALKKCKMLSCNLLAASILINKITVLYSRLNLKQRQAAEIWML
jgi:hypothetical protein